MKQVEKIWAELSAKAQEASKEVELSEEQKVELSNLSILKDLAKDSIRFNSAMLGHNREVQNKFKELSASVRAAEQIVSDFDRMKAELEAAAKELGVDISGDIKQAEQSIREAEQTINDMVKRWGGKQLRV